MKKGDNSLILVASVLLGLVLTLSRVPTTSTQQGASAQRAQELLASVSRLEEENSALQRRVGDVQSQLMDYESSMQNTDEMAAQIAKMLENTRMEAGLVALTGPGVVVTIDHLILPASGQVVKYVQDEDLLTVINELNAAGAEAIAINGERLVATSEVRTAGNYINVNTHAQSAPFTITAIGDPQTLNAAMHLYGGVVETLSQVAAISVQSKDAVHVPAYQGVISYEYAQVES